MESNAALDEAAHCCANWRGAADVRYIEITGDENGLCIGEEPRDPLDAWLVARIGGLAQYWLGTSSNDAMSPEDRDYAEAAERRMSHTVNDQLRRYYKELARNLLFELEEPIRALAGLLDRRRRLTCDDLAALVHTEGSPFVCWQRLYPKPLSSRSRSRRDDVPDLAGLIRSVVGSLRGGSGNMRRVSPGSFL